jgi:hypothetical protein
MDTVKLLEVAGRVKAVTVGDVVSWDVVFSAEHDTNAVPLTQFHCQLIELLFSPLTVPFLQSRLSEGWTEKLCPLASPQATLPEADTREKDAVTLLATSMVTVQPAVPLQAPDHPANVLPLAGAAVRVTEEPEENEAEQVEPQLIPPVVDVTVPLPVPDLATERATGTDVPGCPSRTGQ